MEKELREKKLILKMRDIKYIVFHCTATAQNTTVESIQKFWREERLWKNPGYHYIIKADGTVINLLPIELISNGVAGNNSNSINISYIGGIDKKGNAADTRTREQKFSMAKLAIEMHEKFPDAEFRGHRDFPGVTKSCPSFSTKEWASHFGI